MKNQYEDREAARRYDSSVRIWEDGRKRAGEMAVTPGMSVLDIGSGPGILSLPLARRGCRVTAAEPSGAMRELLCRHMEEEQMTEIKILPYTWEELPEELLETYDLILASYSLMMPDFEEAVRKMNRHAGGRVELYWFAGETSWERDRRILEERLGRETRKGQAPKIDSFYQTLCRMGIYSDITMLSGTSFDREYLDFERAVQDMKMRYEISDGEERELRSYLEERLERRGEIWYYRDLTRYGRISWNVMDETYG